MAVVMVPNLRFRRAQFNALDRSLAVTPQAVAAFIVDPAAEAIADAIVEEAKATDAFMDRTGDLRASIRAFEHQDTFNRNIRRKNAQRPAAQQTNTYSIVSAETYYARHVEFQRPFLRPAVEKVAKNADRIAPHAARRHLRKMYNAIRTGKFDLV